MAWTSSDAKTSKLGIFSKQRSMSTIVQNDTDSVEDSGNDTEIGKLSAETTNYMSNPHRRLVPTKDSDADKLEQLSDADKLEQLLEKLNETFVSSFKETLLEQIIVLLEKNETLLESVIKTQKLDKLGINDKWRQSDKLINLVDRLEKLGYKLPDPTLKLENNLYHLHNHLPRLVRS